MTGRESDADEPIGFPFVRGHGARLRDATGRDFIDCDLSDGALILGHAPAAVHAAMDRTLAAGWLSDTTGQSAIPLQHLIRAAGPDNGMPLLFHCSRHAAAFAVGAACMANGQRTVARFSSEPENIGRIQPLRLSNGWTVTERVIPYGNRDALEDIAAGHFPLSAVVIDGADFARNPDGFETWLNDVSGACFARNILVILDETRTGFRLAFGGLQEHLGFEADLAVYGSIVGGGLPLAAVAVRDRIMASIDLDMLGAPQTRPATAVFDPFAVAVGVATLSILSEHRDAIYSHLFASGKAFRDELNELLEKAGCEGRCSGAGPIVSLAAIGDLVRAGRARGGDAIAAAWRRGLYERDIIVGRNDLINLSTAHTEHDLGIVAPEIAAVARTLRDAASAAT